MVGIREEEDIRGFPIIEGYPQWARASILNEAIPRAIRDGSWSGETAFLSRDGREIPVSQVHIAHKAPNGTVEFLSTIARDISERKRIETELQQAKEAAEAANRAKSEFLANMSHEIRTPMNGVTGMINLLLDTELTAEQRELAEIIRTSADTLLTLINDILDFSKIEAGKLDLEIIDFDLRTIVEEVGDLLTLKAHEKGLELVCLVYHDVPLLLQGDPGRLRQILLNLANNAIKFTEKGEVVIRAMLDKETDTHATVRFSVTDTGIGIPNDRRERLFKSFSQVDASTSRKYGGTGLGLVISKKLAEMMGGQIGVESEEGKGSTFWFTAVFEKQSKDREEKPAVDRVCDRRILIVDDNATNRLVLREQLKSWGYGFDEAAGGEEALAKLRQATAQNDPFDLAILDMMMPEMDGETLGRKIKAKAELKDTILIMLSSAALRGEAARMKEIGFSAYLTKPVKQSQLYDCLATVLNGRAAKPTTKAKSAEPSVTASSIADDKRHRARILLAEDNVVNQKVALRILEKRGYHADVVSNGKEAVHAVATTPYDLVLMDVQMPEMDGFEATAAIRAREKATGAHVPIIAMTAHAMKGDRERCLEAGMDGYVSKPIQAEELFEAITSLVPITGAPGEAVRVEEVIDASLHELLARLDGDVEFLRRLMEVFDETSRALLSEIHEAIARGDTEALARAAHTLKGSVGNFAPHGDAFETALRLEMMGSNGDMSGAEQAYLVLEAEIERLKSAVMAFGEANGH
jgi:signal transduction histidine kinase/DNA-binding response OmpR family regulator